MPATNHISLSPYVNKNDPATWLCPDQQLIGADGRDWAWCYVVFADVPEWLGYRAGTNGTIWTCLKLYSLGNHRGTESRPDGPWKKLSFSLNPKNGYLQIGMANLGKKRTNRVHSIILKTFWGPPKRGQECRHLNGRKNDNRFANLCWGTRVENWGDRVIHGTDPFGKGERSPNAKLSKADIREIRRLRGSGMIQSEIADRFKVSISTISDIDRKITWSHIE